MAQETPEALRKRQEAAQKEADANRPLYEDVYDFIMPFRNRCGRDDKRHATATKQFDSTAQIAAVNFVNKMQSDFTPLNTMWCKLSAGALVEGKERERMNKMLEPLTNTMFAHLHASNFSVASPVSYMDLCVSTMVIFQSESTDKVPFKFSAAPITEVAIEQGAFDDVSACFRQRNLTPRQARATWKDIKPGELFKEAEQDAPDKEIAFRECVYYDPEDVLWRYEVLQSGEKNETERIVERNTPEQPFYVSPYMQIPGMATGVGPAMLAMADYKTLNKLKELQLRIATLQAFGVYTISDNAAFNPKAVSLSPGAFIPVSSNGGPAGPSIQRLDTGGNFQIQEFLLEDLKSQVRQTMLDNRLPPEFKPGFTAFEIAERLRELQGDIGVAFGRLMRGFITPMFKRSLGIMSRRGIFDLPEWFEIDHLGIGIEMLTPLAQQEQMKELERGLQAIQMTKGISPELAMMSFDLEKLPGYIVEKIGASSEILTSEEKRAQIQKMAAQLVAQQQQQQGGGNAAAL